MSALCMLNKCWSSVSFLVMPFMFICSIFRLLVLGCVRLEVFCCVFVVDGGDCVGEVVGEVGDVGVGCCCDGCGGGGVLL